MEMSTFASGYKRLYVTDEEELAACLGEARETLQRSTGSAMVPWGTAVWQRATIDDLGNPVHGQRRCLGKLLARW